MAASAIAAKRTAHGFDDSFACIGAWAAHGRTGTGPFEINWG
jgi:hypothetical protein